MAKHSLSPTEPITEQRSLATGLIFMHAHLCTAVCLRLEMPTYSVSFCVLWLELWLAISLRDYSERRVRVRMMDMVRLKVSVRISKVNIMCHGMIM